MVFAGANVYIQDGSGSTYSASPNGLGNFIVGYDEDEDSDMDEDSDEDEDIDGKKARLENIVQLHLQLPAKEKHANAKQTKKTQPSQHQSTHNVIQITN